MRDTPDRPRTEVRARAERLGGYEGSPYWPLLSQEQRDLVRDPGSHRDLPDGSRYPLHIGQLATLVDGDAERLRYWSNQGLLPTARGGNGYRLYYQEAVVRAFVFENLNQSEITVLREIKEFGGAALMAGLAAILHEQAGLAGQESHHDALERAATSLSEVSASLSSRGRYQRRARSTKRQRRTAAS